MKVKPSKAVASHILPASANLLGICFLIFSMARRGTDWNVTVLDDCAAFATVLFLIASICSYLALRADGGEKLEIAADFAFFSGLIVMAIVSVLISFAFIR